MVAAHGGLSSLNRELCKALAAAGNQVSCTAIDPSQDDIADAARHRVRLIPAPSNAGVEGIARLFLIPRRELDKVGPQFVIGHDHITGAAGYSIAKNSLDAVPYIHFVHTLPEEIEVYKGSNALGSFQRGAEKGDLQRRQCKQADLVVGVGPRIFEDVDLRVGGSPKVVQLRPGLIREYRSVRRSPTRLPLFALFQGRLEDAPLKGAPLACRTVAGLRQEGGFLPGGMPRLILRGFDQDRMEEQLAGLGDAAVLREFILARFFTTEAEPLTADLAASSLVLMPSQREGFGLVALEAIAAGIPVLISAQSGIARMLMDDPEIVAATRGSTVSDCILDVEGRTQGEVDAEWIRQAGAILRDRAAAFERAERLRQQLEPILTWEAAARALLDEMRMLL